MNYKYFNWTEIESQCLELAKKIKKGTFNPDILVVLARGGFLIARLLSDYLNIREVSILQLEYYTDIGEKRLSPNLISDIPCNVNEKNILLCDDVIDTGESMIFTIEHIKNKGCKDVKIATLHTKPHSKFIPDFYVEEVDAWIIYPWEICETIKKIRKSIKNNLKLEEMLLELGIEKELLKKIFNFMKF
ncbi:MAG: phosphoribosyltransferase [Candidatus Helarchaeota archaeon]